MSEANQNCPCGSGQTYANCCEPFHSGKSHPETAEKLMRSRYAAYVVGKIDWIAETNDPESKEGFDRDASEEWSKKSEWLGLEIVATKDGQAKDIEGEVEFKANYKTDGTSHTHHEVSLFQKKGKPARWYYVDGRTVVAPVVRSEPKVGRNDPCACGSGKKSKKCCAA
jgi:SEC-C motif-containing protein